MRLDENEQLYSPSAPNGPVRTIVEFCQFARRNGFSAGPKETIGCVQMLRSVGLVDFEAVRFGLRSVLCSSKEEWDLFGKIFDVFWGSGRDTVRASSTTRKDRRVLGRIEGDVETWPYGKLTDLRPASGRDALPSVSAQADAADGRRVLDQGGDQTVDRGEAVSGASASERLRKIDFSEVPQADLGELERISIQLLRQMSERVSRRLKAGRTRGMVDLRRTLRLNIAHGGDPIELCYKGRKREQPRLVLLLDVSDSMNLYSLFLLKFAFALSRHLRKVESFIFSTRLMEISSLMKARALPEALAKLSTTKTGWSGGTRIGDSLREFNRLYARRLLSHSTVFTILSDGCDTGEPEALVAELKIVKRRVQKLIWLNPLLGLDGYEPITRGMSAALPYIDVFAPGHNLESLLELEKHLSVGKSQSFY